jgi:hypothetical protein
MWISFVAMSLGLVGSGAGFARDAESVTLQGGLQIQVVSAETRRPLEGVTVTVTPRQGTTLSALTSVGGIVEFRELDEGLYDLSAARWGLLQVAEPSVRVVRRKVTPLLFEMQVAERNIAEELALDTSVLEEVIIRARSRGREADPYGSISNSFFNREELRSAVGAGSDAMRALDGMPGLVSTGDFANFSVRGRGPRDNLIYIDGFPFDRVVHFDQTLGEEEDIGGGGRFSIFAPNSIAGAEFSPGGWSAAYGGRSGSLLKLDVAGGAPTPSASLRIDIAGFELGYEGPSGVRDDTTMFFTARSFDFGRVFDQIDERDIGQPELTDIVLKTVTRLDEDDSIEFLGIFAPEKYTRDIDNVLASPNFEDVSLIDAEQDLSLAGLTWRRLVGDAGEWTNRLYVRANDKTTSEGEAYPDLVPSGAAAASIPVRERLLTVTENETETGWRSDYTVRNGVGQGSIGLHVWRTDVDYSVRLREDLDRFVYRSTDPRPLGQRYITLTPGAIDSTYSANETNYSVYSEQVVDLGDWDVRAGLRYDRDGFSDESLFSPRFALNWRPQADLRVSATAGIFRQSPRLLVRSADPDNFKVESERSSHVSIGFEQDFGTDWSLLVETYYQRLENLVVEESRTSGRVNNDGEGTNRGVDLVLSRRFADGWFGNVVYAFNEARLNDNNGLGEYDASFNRDHFFSVGGSWEIDQRWKVGARWKWATARPSDDFVINQDVLGQGRPLRYSKELTQRNALRGDDYHSLNIRVDYRRPIGPVDLVMFVDIINVYGGPEGGGAGDFDPRRGVNINDDGEAFPILGLIFERAW